MQETYCELLRGQGGDECVIILNGDVPFESLYKVFSGYFELEPPAPWDKYWLVSPKAICADGCDLRSFAIDLRNEGIDIKVPPVTPQGTPTFQEVFGI